MFINSLTMIVVSIMCFIAIYVVEVKDKSNKSNKKAKQTKVKANSKVKTEAKRLEQWQQVKHNRVVEKADLYAAIAKFYREQERIKEDLERVLTDRDLLDLLESNYRSISDADMIMLEMAFGLREDFVAQLGELIKSPIIFRRDLMMHICEKLGFIVVKDELPYINPSYYHKIMKLQEELEYKKIA